MIIWLIFRDGRIRMLIKSASGWEQSNIVTQCECLQYFLSIYLMQGGDKVQSPAKKKIPLTTQDFTLKHKLGKGAYGDVYLVIKNSDKKVYAMKQIQKKKLQRQQKQYQAMVEKQLLSNCKHPGIVTLKYTFQDKANLYFIQEFCEGGEFINFIKLNINKLTDQIKIFYIAQIVNILEYLHSHGITHRDLKPENLMLDKKGHLKLIDFGTAQITNCKLLTPQFKEHILKLKQKSDAFEQQHSHAEIEEDDIEQTKALKKRRSTFVGTCYYISPELLEKNYCPPSADLWALGCIIYQLYYLETPFKDNYQFAVFQKIKKAEVTFTKNQLITEEAIDLIKRLLIKNPAERLGSCSRQQLSYNNLKSHPYFKGFDINNIFSSNVPFIADLQQPEKNEQQKKEKEQQLVLFKQNHPEVIKRIESVGKEILKSAILQEKSFVFYNYAILSLTKSKELEIVSGEDFSVKKEIKVKEGVNKGVRLLDAERFQIYGEDKVYHLRSSEANEWVKILQSQL